MDGWNTSFLLGWPIFRFYVSFRECMLWFHISWIIGPKSADNIFCTKAAVVACTQEAPFELLCNCVDPLHLAQETYRNCVVMPSLNPWNHLLLYVFFVLSLQLLQNHSLSVIHLNDFSGLPLDTGANGRRKASNEVNAQTALGDSFARLSKWPSFSELESRTKTYSAFLLVNQNQVQKWKVKAFKHQNTVSCHCCPEDRKSKTISCLSQPSQAQHVDRISWSKQTYTNKKHRHDSILSPVHPKLSDH